MSPRWTLLVVPLLAVAFTILWAITGLFIFPGVLAAVLVWGAFDTRRRRRTQGADYRRFTPPSI